MKSSRLRAGDWVEVRSKDEILRTLDSRGQLDGMPFMPEMFAFCGKQFQVFKRAHKTCDTVFPVRGRRVANAVHLETRCDGSAHGGCQASCMLFWKDAWLKPITGGPSGSTLQPEAIPAGRNGESSAPQCTESLLLAATQRPDATSGQPLYTCQATQLPYATAPLAWWDIRQYVEDYISGNVGLGRIISGAIYFLCHWLSSIGIGLGRPIRWLYDTFYPLWRGAPYPRRRGAIPDGDPTPAAELDLQPGEFVRIKPFEEILPTLNTRNRNRGLYFDAEEVPYCGGTYRVLKRVTKIIDERTGRMREMKTPCFILDSVVCQSRYSECRLFCPRSIYSYWREIWLERVDSNPSFTGCKSAGQVASPTQTDPAAGNEQEVRVSLVDRS
jgi:hypothetical protein